MNGKNNFLVDTNIILGFLGGHKEINIFFQQNLTNQILSASQISRMELLGYPNITIEEETSLNSFLLLVKILPITDAICNQAITLRRKTRLKLPDALIAATAICFDLVLITCDADLLGNISNITSLKSINPVRELT